MPTYKIQITAPAFTAPITGDLNSDILSCDQAPQALSLVTDNDVDPPRAVYEFEIVAADLEAAIVAAAAQIAAKPCHAEE